MDKELDIVVKKEFEIFEKEVKSIVLDVNKVKEELIKWISTKE